MALRITFRGITLADNGTYPRAKVTVSLADVDIPAGLSFPSISIDLPLSETDVGEPVQVIADRARSAASQLVSESALREWVRSVAEPPPPAASRPG